MLGLVGPCDRHIYWGLVRDVMCLFVGQANIKMSCVYL